jgi:hypothetical protein
MNNARWLLAAPVFLAILLVFASPAEPTRAQQNPTPVVITLTPEGSPTVVPDPTSDGAFQPDRFEPNDEPGMATPIGWQTEAGLTLVGPDVDYFRAYLKAGQTAGLSTTVYGSLDTRLKLFWGGQLVAENDDRSPVDMGSSLTWTATADGWLVVLVEKVTTADGRAADGRYDLEATLIAPTATPTASPTLTPTPSPTPLVSPDLAEPNDTPETAHPLTPGMRAIYTLSPGDVDHFRFIAKAGSAYSCETVTAQVDTLLTVAAGGTVLGQDDDRDPGRIDSFLTWMTPDEQSVVVRVEARGGGYGQYELICRAAAWDPAAPAMPSGSTPPLRAPRTTLGITDTAVVTATEVVSLTVHHLGRVQPRAESAMTHVRLLVYYDANNDRSPGPGEGVANVSVLAVDAQGQRIARVFTNVQGEAVFNLGSDAVTRVIVPFVPGWSARVRVGEANEGIVLGLPAVRLPVFLPVAERPAGKE